MDRYLFLANMIACQVKAGCRMADRHTGPCLPTRR
jgi:hypothetical protein